MLTEEIIQIMDAQEEAYKMGYSAGCEKEEK